MINASSNANLDTSDLLVVVGGTLVCAGGLVLSRIPEVREGFQRLASNPKVTRFGRVVLAGAVYQVGGALQRWGDSAKR